MNDEHRERLHKLLDKMIDEEQPIGVMDVIDLVEDGTDRYHYRLSFFKEYEHFPQYLK